MSEGTVATPQAAGAPVTSAPTPGQPETPAQAEARRFKVKVNNQEMEVDERELVTGYQTRKAADEKFRQASEIKREYDEMANDPEAFFKKNKMNPEEWAEKILIKKLKLEQMTPEQREALAVKQENEKLKKEKADRDKALEDEQLKGVTLQAVQSLDTELTHALQNANLVNIEPAFIARVADKMLAYHDKHDGERMPAARAVELVKAENEAMLKAFAKKLPVDDLMRLLSDQSDAIRKHFINKAVENSPMRKPRAQSEPRTATNKPKAKTTTDDFFKRLEQKLS